MPSFNPRARGGRDVGIVREVFPSHARFNPRARGGRDCIRAAKHRLKKVSIHAPAGGATGF